MKKVCPMVTRGKAKGRGGNAKPRTRPYPYELRPLKNRPDLRFYTSRKIFSENLR